MTKYLKYIYYPIGIVLLLLTIGELWPIVKGVVTNLSKYQWLFYGIIIFFIIRRFSFFARNEEWLQTTSHETTHAIVGILFLHKIHSFQAGEREGVVMHSGRSFGNIFITLAPYCLPFTTYLILLFRIIGADDMLYIFDIFIGITLAFHILCFWSQTSPRQPDIQKYGLIGSFLFIAIALTFNASVILLSIRRGLIGAISDLFSNYWDTITNWLSAIF